MSNHELEQRHTESTDAVRAAMLWDQDKVEQFQSEEEQLRMERVQRALNRE